MTVAQSYLRAYDEQHRTDAETPGETAVTHRGPLRVVTFAGGDEDSSPTATWPVPIMIGDSSASTLDWYRDLAQAGLDGGQRRRYRRISSRS